MLEKLERNNQTMTTIHVFVDNARYHHAKILQPWLKQRRTPGEVAFLASICPASQPNRAPLGRHARLGHTQSALCNVQPVHQGDF